MNITAAVDGVAQVQRLFHALETNAADAARIAANMLGEDAQKAVRDNIARRFTFRGTRDQFNRAVVFNRARIRNGHEVQAELRVGGSDTFRTSATQKLGTMLARHENADSRSTSGQIFYNSRGKAMSNLGYYLPANGLRTSTTNPPRKLYPSAIGVALRRTPENRLIRAKGTRKATRKSYGVSYFATEQGIFRRVHSGFGRAEAQAVWWFRRRIRTPARLGMWETAQRVFATNGTAYAIRAIETVLRRGGA